LEFQGSCPQDYQVSVGLKDLSFPASTRENQSSLGMSFSSWPPSLRNLDMLSSMQVVPNMEVQVELFNCKYFHTIRSLCWLYKNVGNTAILISKIDIFPASLRTCNLCSNYNFLCVSSDDNCSWRLLPLIDAWFFLVSLHLWSLVFLTIYFIFH